MKKSGRKIRRKLFKLVTRLVLILAAAFFVVWGLWATGSCLLGLRGNTINTNLFFYDDIVGTLVPVQRDVEGGSAYLENVVRALIEGPIEGEHVQATINPQTRLRGIAVEEGLATVNLSSEFQTLVNPQVVSEKMVAYSVINTLTLTGEIDRVRFLVDGQTPTHLSNETKLFDLSGEYTELTEEPPPTREYSLFFPDIDNRFIAAEKTRVRQTVDTAETAKLLVRRYLQGPKNDFLVSPLSPKTQVGQVTLSQSLLTVDLSSDAYESNLSADGETSMLSSLTWTLTELPGVLKVKILIGGIQANTIGGHHDIREPLTRWDEDRLVDIEGVGVPILIYFSYETPDGDFLLVPRWRFIPTTDDLVKKAFELLLIGPDADESELAIGTCIPRETTGSAVTEGSQISCNLMLGDKQKEIENQAYEAMLVSQLVHTLTETSRNTSEVQITIDDLIQESLPYGTSISGSLLRNP